MTSSACTGISSSASSCSSLHLYLYLYRILPVIF